MAEGSMHGFGGGGTSVKSFKAVVMFATGCVETAVFVLFGVTDFSGTLSLRFFFLFISALLGVAVTFCTNASTSSSSSSCSSLSAPPSSLSHLYIVHRVLA